MNPRAPLWRCLALYRETPWAFLATSLLFLLVNLGLALQQWLVGRAVHDVETGQAVVRDALGQLDSRVAWHWLLILAAVAAGRGVLQYLTGLFALCIGQNLLFTLRERILAQVHRLDLAYHWQHGIGEIITRTTRDADKLRDALISFWRQVFETGLVLLVAVGLLAFYHPLLGLVPGGLTLVAMAIFLRHTDALVSLDRATGAAYDQVSQDLSEGIHGVRVIKSFSLEIPRIDRFIRHVGLFAEQARLALAYSCRRIALPQIIVALGQVWILVYGLVLVSRGQLNLGEEVTCLLLANTLVFRVEGIGRVMQVFADARASAARIWEFLDARPAITDPGSGEAPQACGFFLDGVSVRSPGGEHYLLENCSLKVAPGQCLALVGATGSGKSTLAALLPRLADPDRGAVRLGSDDLGWHDVRGIGLAALRQAVHGVPQESFLFSDTLAANLRLAAPGAGDGELLEALTLAAADEVVERLREGLREGLETRLGDRGITLSGGQRQRLCLARAFLARPRLLILDDATSALDAVTEQRILRDLRRTAGATTLLIITSRLSTLLHADQVALLQDGHIADQGTHPELLARNPHYAHLLGLSQPS